MVKKVLGTGTTKEYPKRTKLNRQKEVREAKGVELRARKAKQGIEECFWAMGNTTTHYDTHSIEGKEDR